MAAYRYGITDFQKVSAGAAVLGSGGGGSYVDALSIINELALVWSGSVVVQDYDGATNCCMLALMGSPDGAQDLTLANVTFSVNNTLSVLENTLGENIFCITPGEIGPINSLVPLIAAAWSGNVVSWVVNGDGAGRAVPELPQTTFAGASNWAVTPCALANDAQVASALQSAVLGATTAAAAESLAGGIVAAFGSYSGIALWPSTAANGYALSGNYLQGTLNQAWLLGEYLLAAGSPPTTAAVTARIATITGRIATAVATNFYITDVTQATTSASLDAGVIRLDNAVNQADSTETHYIYNLNENLIMYSSVSNMPSIIAPDSICYYSEGTGRGFSNATNDLAQYYDASTGLSTGVPVSVIKVAAAKQFYQASGVVGSFAELLRNIGYAGQMPYPI